eukprot:scaffold24531_cov59-Phaeocystis_antarctica.AAC.2
MAGSAPLAPLPPPLAAPPLAEGSKSKLHARIGPAHSHGRAAPAVTGTTWPRMYTSAASTDAGLGLAPAAGAAPASLAASALAAALTAASVPSGRARKSERGAVDASHSRKLARAIDGITFLVSNGCASSRR